MNSLIISLYKTNDVVAQLSPTHNGSTYPEVIHNKNKLSRIAIWGLLFTNVLLNESLYIMFWAVPISSIDSVTCYAYDGRKICNFLLKLQINKFFLETCLPRGVSLVQHGVKGVCYNYDQTIEDINILSPAFWLSLGGGGSTYLVDQLTPLSPTECSSTCTFSPAHNKKFGGVTPDRTSLATTLSVKRNLSLLQGDAH